MKNLIYLLLAIPLFITSCSDDSHIIPRSSFTFELSTDGIDSLVSYDDAISINSRGTNSAATTGYQTVHAASSGRDGVGGGIKFKFRLQPTDSITSDYFLSLFEENVSHSFGNWTDNHALYYGKLVDDKIVQYTTTEVEFVGNSMTVTSGPELIAETEDGEDYYRIEVTFDAKLTNLDDSSDRISIKDGVATLYIVDFSSK